ncbi:glycoside hydrolase 15 protein [Physocladia obscura]|uniref:glucan 1,4-alpha-glucosidase n=1 Tax=Physocladia obscura TaxID=109957 RepID=A0AAD5T6L3_9FUNG|nr:glycoside hydrolase 15 protein [Physocladia obscura]
MQAWETCIFEDLLGFTQQMGGYTVGSLVNPEYNHVEYIPMPVPVLQNTNNKNNFSNSQYFQAEPADIMDLINAATLPLHSEFQYAERERERAFKFELATDNDLFSRLLAQSPTPPPRPTLPPSMLDDCRCLSSETNKSSPTPIPKNSKNPKNPKNPNLNQKYPNLNQKNHNPNQNQNSDHILPIHDADIFIITNSKNNKTSSSISEDKAQQSKETPTRQKSTIGSRLPCLHSTTCQKTFSSKAHLKRHLKIHAKDKRFKCIFDNCDSRFVRSDNLSQHLLKTTVHPSVPSPTTGPQVQTEDYGYDGTTLSGTLWVQNIAYTKVVQVIYSTANGDWNNNGNVINAVYQAPSTNGYETWTFSAAVSSIAEFYVKYQVSGNTYYDNNNSQNYAVTAPPAPAACTGTPTHAVTSGIQSDITAYFNAGVPSFTQYLFNNIHPAGTSPGIVVAAPENNTVNDYFYHWIRDSSLVMNTVNQIYIQQNARNSTLEQLFFNFQNITYKMQNENADTGLGEAKFNVDGSDFTGGWCRPQNDGPALRATAFINFATQYLAVGGSLATVKALWTGSSGVIVPDLNYVISNYNSASGCDLWEEQRGLFFWSYGAQRKSLHLAATFATLIGDTTNAATFESAASTLDASYSQFYNGSYVQEILEGNGRVFDTATPLGAIHNDIGDGVLTSSDSRILATIYQFGYGMISQFPLNTAVTTNAAGLPLGVAIGRYYGDTYNGGSGSAGGNPWFLANAAMAEVAYRAAIAYTKAGCITVDSHNIQLFNGALPAGLGLSVAAGSYASNSTTFNSIIAALEVYGDKHIRRIQYHGAAGYHLNEEYDHSTGVVRGVFDLTWSYSAILTAYWARQQLISL